MARAVIEQIDILRVFRRAGDLMMCLVIVLLAVLVGYYLEPRDDIGQRKLQVRETGWHMARGDYTGSVLTLQAKVILPNGNTHSFSVKRRLLDTDGTLCASVKLGRWTDAYHIEFIDPERCWGLPQPEQVVRDPSG